MSVYSSSSLKIKPKLSNYFQNGQYNLFDYAIARAKHYRLIKNQKKTTSTSIKIKRTRISKIRRDPKTSFWWLEYVMNPNHTYNCEDHADGKLFRRRFCVPYELYLKIVDWSKEWNQYQNVDACGRSSIPLELLVLCVLRILGRAWTFDCCNEATFISERKISSFFHEFIKRYAKEIFPRICKPPETDEEIIECMKYYEPSGFAGCIGSVDVTHIKWNSCTKHNSVLHTSRYKTKTRAYEVTVNHKKECLAVSPGLYGSYSDKLIVKFDQFVMSIHRGQLYQDVKFKLYDMNGILHEHTGCYLLSDNGYSKWRCLQCPMKLSLDHDGILQTTWSKTLESVRKDVECFYGIIKCRFQILNGSLRMKSSESIDYIFLTCCTLHNQLLRWDGLDNWTEGNITDFNSQFVNDTENDHYEGEAVSVHVNHVMQRIIQRANNAQSLPLSNPGEDVELEVDTEGINEHLALRSALIEHFSYLWSQNRIIWTTRVRR